MTQAEQLLNEIARILLTTEGAERANAIDKQVADVAEFCGEHYTLHKDQCDEI